MEKKFEQIQHCAIVEYTSPLTEGKTVVGIFYKQSWQLMYHLDGIPHTITVTPSQTCTLILGSFRVLYDVYMQQYADLRTEKEKEEDSEL